MGFGSRPHDRNSKFACLSHWHSGIGIVAVAAHYLTRGIVRFLVYPVIRHGKTKWDDMLIEHKVLLRCCHLSPAIAIYLLASVFPGNAEFTAFLEILVNAYFIVILLLVIDGVLNFLHQAWESAPC